VSSQAPQIGHHLFLEIYFFTISKGKWKRYRHTVEPCSDKTEVTKIGGKWVYQAFFIGN
jgi:hypothetical protein